MPDARALDAGRDTPAVVKKGIVLCHAPGGAARQAGRHPPGQLHQWRSAEGDADKARQLWRQAADGYAALGMSDHAALIERLLAGEPAVLSV